MFKKLIFLTIFFTVSWPLVLLGAEKRPTTMAELALYKGADRQRILEEGAKKE